MRFLLDENFPLGLLRVLRSDGWDADHIITLAWRGASDQRIRERLRDPQIVFFTQDDDFLFGETVAAVVVLSRVRQSRPLKERIEVWRKACHELAQTPRVERLFELTNEGVLLRWQDPPPDRPQPRINVVTLRCTQKLLRRLGRPIVAHPARSSTVLGDWYADLLFTQHCQLVLCVSENARLPIVIPARELRTLDRRQRIAAGAVLKDLQVNAFDVSRELAGMETLTVAVLAEPPRRSGRLIRRFR